MKMKFIKAIMGLGAILMATAVGANAQVTVDDSTSVITVSGAVESKNSDVRIGIDVFCPDKSYDDLRTVSEDKFASVIALRHQVTSGKEGAWELSFKIADNPLLDYDAKSGEYTIVISPDDGQKSYTEKFMYVNIAEAENYLKDLKTANREEALQILESGKNALGINYDFYASLDKGKIADILLAESKALDNATTAEGIAIVRKAAFIEAVCEGKIGNLFDYADYFGIAETDIAPYTEKKYIVINQGSITQRLNGKTVTDFNDFNDKLTEATVLAVVKNPDGEANLKEIIGAFEDEIGYTAPLKDSAYIKVSGNTYESYEKLATALNSANNGSAPSGPSGGGGGGSSSGGASSGGSGVMVPSPSDALPMEYDIFTDIDDISWAKDAIIYLAQKGIINGKSDKIFAPNDFVTREEAAKILVLAFVPDTQGTKISFEDVSVDSWYYQYVSKAVETGIVTGYSESVFGSGDSITRQDLVTMIYRAAVNSGIELEEGQISFADENEIADYAREAVGALAKAEIVSGTDFRIFEPAEPATRAQLAKIVYRLLEL